MNADNDTGIHLLRGQHARHIYFTVCLVLCLAVRNMFRVTSSLTTVLHHPENQPGTTKTKLQQLELEVRDRYSERPLDHLTFTNRTAQLSPFVPILEMIYFQDSGRTLRKRDGLYDFDSYLITFEGSVTHTWLGILATLRSLPSARVEDYIVVDGGLNTGFYSLLTAKSGYTVHSFDVQLDCFDVSKLLMSKNHGLAKSHFYFKGLWLDDHKHFSVEEGCDPGRGLDDYHEAPALGVEWQHKRHNVSTTTLDTALDGFLTSPSTKVAILKLDIEGAEPAALEGLDKYMDRVENIILECVLRRMKRMGFSLDQVRTQFTRLQESGFTPYLLYQIRIPFENWFNDAYLMENAGVVSVKVHPILGENIENITATMTNAVLWRIQDMEKFFSTNLFVASNLLFTRMAITD
eukprot:scaffold74719_cov52-Attheya_sp.AAC.2